MTTPLIKDLQEIAYLSALLVENKDLSNLNPTETKLAETLTKQNFIIPNSNPVGYVGQARRHKPPSKS